LEEAINGILETIGYTEKIVLKNYISADASGVLSDAGEQEPLEIADSRVQRTNVEDTNIN
jgi:hypothetical protein